MTRQSVFARLLLVLFGVLLLNGCWSDHKKGQETQGSAASAQPVFQLDTPTQSVEVDSDEYTLDGEIQSRWALDSLSMSYEGKNVPLSTSKPKSKRNSSNLVQAASSTLYTYYFSLTVKLAQPGVNQFVFIIKTPEGESQHQVEIKRKDHSNTPLQITLAANQESVTYGDTLLLAGQVLDDKGSGEGISLTISNSLTGQSQVVASDSQGHFSQSVALPLGRSTLTLKAEKSGYQSASQSLSVQRRSLPQLTITSPANGAELESESVTIEGEVVSLWPKEQLKLVQGDAVLTLDASSAGHYHFSHKVTLQEGSNSFSFVLQTPDGDSQQVIQLQRKVTPKPDPKLTLTFAADQATLTDGESLLVSGVTQDESGSGVGITLTLLSDKSSERVAVSVAADGHFSQAIPLPLGASKLTLLAEKSGYQSASQSLSVQRRSLPQLTITSPANGAALESESVTIEGEVISLWPQDQLVLTHAGQAVVLQPTSFGHYHFSQSVALVEGDNSFSFVLQTPDGNAQQVLQLQRKVIPKPALKLTLTLAADQATLTDGESLLVSGVTQDESASGAGITLTLLSDKSSERVAVSVAADGHFSQAIPLPLGSSKLTLLAEKSGYQSASQSLSVQRRSLPQLSITSPTNGAELESESVTIEGEVISLWPQEQLVLTHAGQAVVLQLTSTGHYHFSQSVALVEGDNSFSFVLQTPDGNTQQVIQLQRKVTPKPDLKLTLTLAADQATLTDGESLLVSGVTQDESGSGAGITLTLLSDKSSERVAVSVAADGHFSQAIPLPLGSSKLTLLAEKSGYQGASQSLSVQRRSLPQLTITSPTNGAELESENVTVEGEVISLWSQDQLVLTHAGQAVVLQPTSSGHYHFSHKVTLQEGSNSFTFVLQTPDGDSQQVLQLQRKVTPKPDLKLTLSLAADQATQTDGESLLVSGLTQDKSASAVGITLTLLSDKSSERVAVSVAADGHFSQAIPLPLGASKLTLLAEKSGYQSASQSLSVQRRSLPQLSITSPANGAELESESATIEGAVISLWPQEQLVLTQAGQSVVLQPTSTGHYHFSHKVTLQEGSNSFTFVLHTPDGNTQQAIQLQRKVTPKPDPKLTLTLAADQITQTDGESLLVSGVTQDESGSGVGITLTLLSDKSSERVAVSVAADGHFSQAIPLPLGASKLTLLAEKSGYQSASQSLSVQRRSLPQLTITSPANGSELSDEIVTVSGRVLSAWPKSELVLHRGSEILPLELVSAGIYQFKQQVVLNEGSNTLTYLLQSPDGDSQQILVISRKATPKPDPKLTLSLAADQATQTDGETLLISGLAQDEQRNGTGISLKVLNDRLGETSLSVDGDGHFSQAISLPLGSSKLTLLVEKSGYQSASQSLSVQRRSLPQLSITSPTNGAELESESATIEGEVVSLWPQEQLVLTQAGQAVVLQPTSTGHYHFSQSVALVEGDNSFSFVLQTPDGNTQQVVQLQRKVTPKPDLKLTLTLAADQATQTDGESLLVSGVTQDESGSGVGITLTLLSDKSSERVAVSVAADGHFSQAIPLPLGSSQLTLLAEKAGYQSASQSLSVQRRSLPQLSITSPANGAVLESESVAVEGEVISLWPQDQLVLTQAGQSVTLAPTQKGHYRFSHTVALAEGSNNLLFILATPDGERRAEVKLTRQNADRQGPTLQITTANDLHVAASEQVIVGSVSDASGIKQLVLRSSAYPGTDFVAALKGESFQATVPLKPGQNQITVLAEDTLGNRTQQQLTLFRGTPPEFVAISPAANSVVSSATTTVSGEIRSQEGDPVLRLFINDRAASLTPLEGGRYHFELAEYPLTIGSNRVQLLAETALAQADSEVTFSYQPQNSDAIAAPTLTLLTPANNSLVTADPVTVKGQVESHAGPVVLTLEGKRITISSQNSYANGDTWMGYFTTQLSFAEGKNVLDGLLKAEDGLGKSAKLALHFTKDGSAPVLSVAALQPAPAINRIEQQSLLVSGEVSDDNLANLTLNDQALTLEPQAQEGHYRFSTQVAVPAGDGLPLLFVARDLGGNQSAKEFRVQTLSAVSLKPVLPADDSELLSQGEAMTLQVVAQLENLPSDAKVDVTLDAATPITLASDQQMASGELSVPPEAATHTLTYRVVQGGKTLATAERHFKVVDDKSIPLALLSVTPQSGSTGVEPDEPLVLYFNKTIDTSLLQVELKETLHGKTYVNSDEAGASFLQAKGYQLQEVHRDQERVELNPSLLPDGKSISFYAKRMLGFGAQALVTISYQGQELSRFTYQVRPLPTFITGNVVDQFNQPLAGVVVELSELARKTVTNADGAFSFGFQEAAGQEIPGGRYRLTINGGLAMPGFGMQQQQISVTGGVNNQLGMIPLLQLNPELAFQEVASGQAKVSFSDGELSLDFSAAHLQFPDSRDHGRLYFQFLPFEQLGANTMAGFTPLWAYAAQPKGVRVEGQVGISLTMPAYNGRYDYIPTGTERVILVGYAQDRGVIAPVGIGRIENHVVHSEGTLALTSLDYIGYVILPVEWQSKLAAVAAGQLSLSALQAEITSTTQSTQAIAQ